MSKLDDMMRPGRHCPLHYRYSPRDLAGQAPLQAETLYVVGGLYGNAAALEAVLAMRDAEARPVTLLFNGDFNWFNVDPPGFQAINETVLGHTATRGNVETELAAPTEGAGCGCGYPDWVEDAVVNRSNAISTRLGRTAGAFPGLTRRLGALPMHLRARVGDLSIGIVHGDAQSLAGWGFAEESLRGPERRAEIGREFEHADVRLFASTHTCLPVCQTFELPAGRCAVINNGATGMPNFRGTRYGLLTRISVHPARRSEPLYGTRIGAVHVDALPVSYDHAAWMDAFQSSWPPGSPGHAGYYPRIADGPDYSVEQAIRGASHAYPPGAAPAA